ncbi:TPA: hypothetical protein ACH3X1_016236 [Trebouxia sp. C0004]
MVPVEEEEGCRVLIKIMSCLGDVKRFDFPKFHNTLRYVEDIQNFGMTDLTITDPKERFNTDIKRAARKTDFKPGNTIAQVA